MSCYSVGSDSSEEEVDIFRSDTIQPKRRKFCSNPSELVTDSNSDDASKIITKEVEHTKSNLSLLIDEIEDMQKGDAAHPDPLNSMSQRSMSGSSDCELPDDRCALFPDVHLKNGKSEVELTGHKAISEDMNQPDNLVSENLDKHVEDTQSISPGSIVKSEHKKFRAVVSTITVVELFKDGDKESNFVAEASGSDMHIYGEQSLTGIPTSEEEARNEMKRRDILAHWTPTEDKKFNMKLSVHQHDKKDRLEISLQKLKGFARKSIPVFVVDYTKDDDGN